MKPGIHTISAETYHDDPCECPSLSAHIIHALCSESPLHAWTQHPKLNPNFSREEAEHFDIGRIVHSLILEGTHKAVVLDRPDWRTKAAQEARDEARLAGLIPILRKNWDAVTEMVAAASKQLGQHKEASNCFQAGKPEVSIVWDEDGVACRARPDWLHDSHKFIDDYKSTSASANPDVISRTMFNNGWDIQAAWYLRALNAVSQPPPLQRIERVFRFVVQETYPSYALSVISPGPDVLMLAEKKILWALDVWRKCVESGEWPGYPTRVCWASLPVWEEERWLAKEQR